MIEHIREGSGTFGGMVGIFAEEPRKRNPMTNDDATEPMEMLDVSGPQSVPDGWNSPVIAPYIDFRLLVDAQSHNLGRHRWSLYIGFERSSDDTQSHQPNPAGRS